MSNFLFVFVDEDDSSVRRGWRNVQYLANRFWKRFSWGYLPTVIARHKWCQ